MSLKWYFSVGSGFMLGFVLCSLIQNTSKDQIDFPFEDFKLIVDAGDQHQQSKPQPVDTDTTSTTGISKARIGGDPSTLLVKDNDNANNMYNDERKNAEMDELAILHELDVLSGGHAAQNLECPPPLIAYQNRIVRPNNGNGTTTKNGDDGDDKEEERQIPKILHISMKSRCMPRDLVRTMKRWETQLPHHSIFFHDDDAVDRILNHEWLEFPGLSKALKCILYRGAMTIDVWRILILWKYGGLYTDIDNWPGDLFTESLIPGNVSAWFLTDPYFRPSQWFMALEPRHPMMYETMTKIVHNLFQMSNVRRPPVVAVTGPKALDYGYQQFLSPMWDQGKEALYQTDTVLTGKLGKTLIKAVGNNLSPKNKPKGMTREEFKHLPHYIGIKQGYSEMVAYNETLTVSRGERIMMESGVLHWEKDIFNKAKGVNIPVGNRGCRSYIKMLDKQEAEAEANVKAATKFNSK